MNALGRVALKGVRRCLERIEEGRIAVRFRGDTLLFGAGTDQPVNVDVHDPDFFTALALGGHVGAAESYISGGWDTDDLTRLVQVFLRNREVLDGLETGPARLVQPFRALAHALNRNTRRGSRKNIVAHYDLGNEFFEKFLDDTMTYSCGIFRDPDSTLREASLEKYDRICRKLDLGESDHVIEIGTGWGGFAIHAASEYTAAGSRPPRSRTNSTGLPRSVSSRPALRIGSRSSSRTTAT